MEQMIDRKKIVLICARSGSKGIKDKNIQKIGKFNLLESTINQAKKIPNIKSIYVSTDSNKYKSIAENSGAIVPFLRSKLLSKDNTPEWKVWQNFINKMGFKDEQIIIVLPTTSPNRKLSDVNKGLRLFKKNNHDIVIAVTESGKNPYYNMLEKKGNILQLSKKSKKIFFRRQAVPKVYDMTTFFYILKCGFIRKKKSIHEGKIGSIVIPKIRATDIDTLIDLEFARLIKKKNLSNY